MNRLLLLAATTIGAMYFAGIVVASSLVQDHNTTRSNRGSIAAPVDTDHEIEKMTADKVPNAEPDTGRNPQTGKEINTTIMKERTGRNPQTGKEINIKDKKD